MKNKKSPNYDTIDRYHSFLYRNKQKYPSFFSYTGCTYIYVYIYIHCKYHKCLYQVIEYIQSMYNY